MRQRRSAADNKGKDAEPIWVTGGKYQPLSGSDIDQIYHSALDILERIGMGDAPEWLSNALIDQGAVLRDDGRLLFRRTCVERAIRRAARRVTLPGFVENKGLEIGGGRVHIGTGGAAVQVLDAADGSFRNSSLDDLYDLMRVVNACDHIHYGVRPVVARDIDHPLALDVNTAFACIKATGKPIGVSFTSPEHLPPVISLFDTALGAGKTFERQPFCMAVIVHAVSPLRFAAEGVEIMRAAMRHGMPLQICTAGQAGATSPASLAGALTQGLAETLAGLMAVDAMKPGHPCIFALMPFISDLRTGAMTGGSGEAAVASAAAAQILKSLDLPSTVSAGITDAKIADAQAGYEKGYTVALSAQAGADMINLSVGMLGSIMVASSEAMVIDDEMCGAILRSVRGIDCSPGMIDLKSIQEVIEGEGHYLGQSQTLKLMKSEYTYPALGDRQSVSDWLDAGEQSIWDRAKTKTGAILQEVPDHLPLKNEERIREHFDIRLRKWGK